MKTKEPPDVPSVKTHGYWTLILISFCVILMSVMFSSNLFAYTYTYYSDQPNPPRTKDGPPYDGTSKEIDSEFGSIKIFYPSQQRDKKGKGLGMSFYVTNKTGELIAFTVEKYELRYTGKTLKAFPGFYKKDDDTQRKRSMRELDAHVHEVPPHFNRSVSLGVLNYSQKYKELTLEIKIKVKHASKEETIHDIIPLYRGYYTISFGKMFLGKFFE